MNKGTCFAVVCVTSLLLTACGSGGGDTGGSGAAATPAAATPMNVALPANGATLAATYGLGSIASFVNDGDSTTTTNFWAANIVGDTVTIDFGRLRNVTSVTVYTNDTSFNSVSPAKYIEISSDSTVWKKTAQLTGGDVGCSSYSAGSGKISCTFSATQSVRYLRARVTSATPGGQHIVELEAQGT